MAQFSPGQLSNTVWLAAIALAVAAAASFWWFSFGRYNRSERDLFSRIDAVVEDGKPSASRIVREFGLPAQCAEKSCFFQGSKLGNASYARGNIRPTSRGLVFVLEDFSGQCVRTRMAATRFGGQVVESCTDSVCWYLQSNHDWGITAFRLSRPRDACVTSVVINSLR